MANYGVVRTDSVKATYVGKLYSTVAEADIENGSLGILGTYLEGERELRSFDAPTDETLAGGKVVLAANPCVNYEGEARYRDERRFINRAKVAFRSYELVPSDVFSVSKVTGTPAVGKYVTVAKDSYIPVVVDEVGDNAFYARIIDLEAMGGVGHVVYSGSMDISYQLVVLEVLRNGQVCSCPEVSED